MGTFAALCLTLLATASDSEQHIPARSLREAWQAIPYTQPGACPDSVLGFDYWPEGGIRTFYCRMLSVFPWQTFLRIAGRPIFLNGPHKNGKLNLHHKTEFGHYDPSFVAWLTVSVIPAMSDSQFRSQTQKTFDAFIRPLARTYYAVYAKMRTRPEWVESRSRHYVELAKTGEISDNFDGLSSFMSPSGFSERPAESDWGAYDPNLQRIAALFWLRRSVDGTALQFFEGLTGLLSTYDRPWLTKTQAQYGGAPLQYRRTP